MIKESTPMVQVCSIKIKKLHYLPRPNTKGLGAEMRGGQAAKVSCA